MAYVVETTLAIATMLIFGSLNTILLKVQLTQRAVGVDGQPKLFEKPWFMTLTMFSSMVLSLVLVAGKKVRERSKSSMTESLMDKSGNSGTAPKLAAGMSYAAKVRLVSIPAMFDLTAIGIALYGMLLLPASIWQILRGAEIIFAEIISVMALKQKSFAYKWLAVAVCTVGIMIVGAGSLLGSQDHNDETTESTDTLALGIALVLFSQIVAAAQMVAEEYLMKEVDLEAMEVIGYEGMWGLLAMVVVVLPVAYLLPGEDAGSSENTIDSFVMLRNSSELSETWFVMFLSCLIYNLSGIMITSYLSAVHRVIIEAMRTLVVWFFAILTYYYVDKDSGFAEAITSTSWIEAVGFVVVFVGQLIYGSLIKVPGLTYPPPEMTFSPTALMSPSAMKSPLYALGAQVTQ